MEYYGTGCDEIDVDHNCGSCGVELARVRSFALLNKSYYETFIADPESDSVWNTGLAAGLIKLIPKTQGEYDGGSPNLSPGFGDQSETLDSYSHMLNIMDPNFAYNRDFWNTIKKSNSYYGIFRSETIGYVTDKVVLIVPTSPIANDDKTKVLWNIQVKWVSENLPAQFEAPLDTMGVCYIP